MYSWLRYDVYTNTLFSRCYIRGWHMDYSFKCPTITKSVEIKKGGRSNA